MRKARFFSLIASIGILVGGLAGPASADDGHHDGRARAHEDHHEGQHEGHHGHGHHHGGEGSPSKRAEEFADLARRQTIWAEADFFTLDQVFSRRDCSSGQDDEVFFLPELVNLGTDSIHCNVPGNRRVLLNLGGWRCLDDHLPPADDPAADCATILDDPTTAVTFTATLDGHTLPGDRVETGNFPVVLPHGTAWSEVVGSDVSGPTTEAYFGYQIVLDPLRCGEHRIDVHVVFGAGTPDEGTTDMTYFLSVGRH
jgi:hypothetical protein